MIRIGPTATPAARALSSSAARQARSDEERAGHADREARNSDAQKVDRLVAIRTGKESIPDMDGDRIFHFTYETGSGEGQGLEDAALSDPLWQPLSAVQAGNIHEVSHGIWNTAGGVLAAHLMLDDIARIYGVE